MEPWRRVGSRRLQSCRVFDVDEVSFASPHDGVARTFYRIEAPDWVNVIPLTSGGDVLFVRQYRFGVESFTLEIPGGMVDPGEDPLAAARRELREETGQLAGRLTELGWVYPNPALQANRCHTYLARDLTDSGSTEPDPHEEFEQVAVPLAEVDLRIARGEITHSLVVAAFRLLGAAAPE